MPVGARPEIDPLVIPLAGIGMAAVVVYLSRRKQQHIAGAADKLLPVVIDHPFAADRQIKDIALHAQRTVNKEIQIAVGLNRRQARHQMGIKRVTRQQRIVLRFGHKLCSPGDIKDTNCPYLVFYPQAEDPYCDAR